MSEDDQSGRSRSSVNRRRFIAAAGAAGIAGIAGCSGGGGDDGSGGSGGSGGSSGGSGGSSGGSSGSGGGTTAGSDGDSTVTLRLWSGNMTDEPSNKKYWQNAIERFNEQSENAQINLTGVPYEGQFKKIRAGAQSGPDATPHIVEMASRKDSMLAAENLEISDMYEGSAVAEKLAPGLSALNQGWGQQMTGNSGSIVCIPCGFRPYINAYKKNWLSAAGLSVSDVNLEGGTITWDEMFSDVYEPMNQTDLAAPDDAAPDTTGMKEGDEEFMSHYAGQWGITTMGTLNDGATHSMLDTEKYRDLIRFQKEGIDKGYFHPNSINHGDEEATTLIWSDKIGSIHVQDVADLWGSFRGQLGAGPYEENYTWGLPNAEEKKSTYALVPILVPFKEAYTSQAEQDAFMEFANWFIASEQEPIRRVKSNGWVPVSPDVLSGDYFSSTSLHEKFWSVVKRTLEEYQVTELPAIEGGSAINFEIPRSMHQRILQQGMSIEEATSIAAKEQNQILKDNGRYEPR